MSKKRNPGMPRARLSHCHHALHPPGTDSCRKAEATTGSWCALGTHWHYKLSWHSRPRSVYICRHSFALIVSARQQRPLLLHKDPTHTHKPRDLTTRDDVEKKHWAPEPRSSPTLKLRPQRATPSAPKATLPRPLRTSGTSRECDLLLAQPFPLMHGTASNPWTTRDGLRWRAKAARSTAGAGGATSRDATVLAPSWRGRGARGDHGGRRPACRSGCARPAPGRQSSRHDAGRANPTCQSQRLRPRPHEARGPARGGCVMDESG